MEESNLINNDNTYNTDMSTSQSTIGENSITNNTLNKDDLQEVTGSGDDAITTPVVSEDNNIEQQPVVEQAEEQPVKPARKRRTARKTTKTEAE